ncbi:MAG: hypothetical protein ABIJ95_07635, partial [Pseudomonadota bacterium]
SLGSAGLLLGKLLVGLILVGVVWATCRTRPHLPLAFALVMVPAVATIAPGFMVRPQIFSFLFFALFVLLIHEKLIRGKDRLFLLPIITALWVNLHGGFLMGLAYFFVVASWQTFSRVVFRKKDSAFADLWAWFLACLAATLANPYGYKLHLFLSQSLSASRDITEWAPVSLLGTSFLGLKGLIALFLILWIVRRKSIRGWEVAGIALTIFAALRHQRHMPFFAMAAAPFLVVHFSRLAVRAREKYPRLTLTALNWYTMAVLLAVAVAFQLVAGSRPYRETHFRILVDPRVYPVRAARFMNINGIHGNLLLPFDWGEFAIWNLPESRVSIDGRFRTVYPEKVIQNHLASQTSPLAWMNLLAKYPAAGISLAPRMPGLKDLAKASEQSSGWVLAYEDHNSLILLRKDFSDNASALAKLEAGKFLEPGKVSWFFP